MAHELLKSPLKDLTRLALLAFALGACGTEAETLPDASEDAAVDTVGDVGADVEVDADVAEDVEVGEDTDVREDVEIGEDTDVSIDIEIGEDTDGGGACPASPPIAESCGGDAEGLHCEWGMECCCGDCFASTVCDCRSGSWQCYATDACFRFDCTGASCSSDDDCRLWSGAASGACVDGVCAPVDCAAQADRAACDSASETCQWVEPPGCVDESAPSLGAAGCFPSQSCATASDCPAGYACEPELQVAPRCMWDEPLCDACQQVQSLCVPRGV
ncbi:MAG: hypothetical protein H6698_08890 [Myxococcales bacterium]|nr:hypothetical protein [Myxococcales bacterium]MCB9534401.1 hypothetical protein [Myxococcales bacterium]